MKNVHLHVSLPEAVRASLKQVLGLLDSHEFSFTDNLAEANVVLLTGRMILEEIHDYDRSFVYVVMPSESAPQLLFPSFSNVAVAKVSEVVTVAMAVCQQAVELPVRPHVRANVPSVLVIDDAVENIASAWAQLGGKWRLTVATTYVQGLKAIQDGQFDIVLTDLMLPASSKAMGTKGLGHVGQLMPLGLILGPLAAKEGATKVAVVTNTSHHDHPMVAAALDDLTFFPCGKSSEVFFFNSGEGAEGKDWQSVLSYMDILEP